MTGSRERYRQLIASSPELFVNPDGAAYFIAPESEWDAVERSRGEQLQAAGGIADWAEIGVVFEDQYVLVLRDPVRRRDGTSTTFLRILQKPLSGQGVVVPLVFSGKLLLVHHFRHATRRWHWEVVRGWADIEDLSYEHTAARETLEETGQTVRNLLKLGAALPDSGLLGTTVQHFKGEVDLPDPLPEPTERQKLEGIDRFELFTPAEFLRMVAAGQIEDDFTAAAFTRLLALGLVHI